MSSCYIGDFLHLQPPHQQPTGSSDSAKPSDVITEERKGLQTAVSATSPADKDKVAILSLQVMLQKSTSPFRKGVTQLWVLQALAKAETLKQEGNKLYADDDLELAVVRPVPYLCGTRTAAASHDRHT